MNNPALHHPPRQFEQRRADDTPGAPMAAWPWIEPASGQARRSGRQQLSHLGEVV